MCDVTCVYNVWECVYSSDDEIWVTRTALTHSALHTRKEWTILWLKCTIFAHFSNRIYYSIFGNRFHITISYTYIRGHITHLLLQHTCLPVSWTEVPNSADLGSPDFHHWWTTEENWEIQLQNPHPHEQTPVWSHTVPHSVHHPLCTDSRETQEFIILHMHVTHDDGDSVVNMFLDLLLVQPLFFFIVPGPTGMLNLQKWWWLSYTYKQEHFYYTHFINEVSNIFFLFWMLPIEGRM